MCLNILDIAILVIITLSALANTTQSAQLCTPGF